MATPERRAARSHRRAHRRRPRGVSRQGIGGRLLDRVLEWARSNELENAYRGVPSTDEDAIEFFAARGWETEAIRADHCKLGDEYIDEVMMAFEP